MTMKTRAKKFRIKRDAPLTTGAAAGVPTPAVSAPPSPERPEPRALTGTISNSPAAAAAVQPTDVSSPSEASTEQSLAEIRKEGLTGRQLRMARRVAQKHGLAPTSDFDAVRLLRARGIDPFQRANMLELVQNEAKGQGTTSGQGQPLAKIAPTQLPQTVPNQQPQLPSTQVRAAEARAGEIYKIQRDIAKRRRRKLMLLMTRLAFFVGLPTLIAGYYYAVMATPLYATNSTFLITKAEPATPSGFGSILGGSPLETSQDSITVQSYLQSRDAMQRLNADLGFKAHFQGDGIDPIQRLDPEASNEDAYKLYKRNVQIGYDPTEGILKMEVIATTPEASEEFSKALISYAEEQIDGLTQRVREEQMKGARESFLAAEARVLEAQAIVLALQEKKGVLDPLGAVASIQQQITTFEIQLREKQLDLDQQLSNTRPNQAKVDALRGEIRRLQATVDDLRNSMTASTVGSESLAKITGELRIAEANLATRQVLLQQSAAQVETAMIEANRQVRYLSIGVSPTAPDEPTYPRVFENTALAFIIFAGIYLMVSLTASILREQVSA